MDFKIAVCMRQLLLYMRASESCKVVALRPLLTAFFSFLSLKNFVTHSPISDVTGR